MIFAGLEHGLLMTKDSAEFLDKTPDGYHPEFERSVLWCYPAKGLDRSLYKLYEQPLLVQKRKSASFEQSHAQC